MARAIIPLPHMPSRSAQDNFTSYFLNINHYVSLNCINMPTHTDDHRVVRYYTQ
jgi:hypothetical protein